MNLTQGMLLHRERTRELHADVLRHTVAEKRRLDRRLTRRYRRQARLATRLSLRLTELGGIGRS
ncbi:hypothetical protein [Phytoactinopolyspora limicola]|uniref:hypothetical protein n=1 Tax=Phytoactinopolyspora limicola TaxID=2715536 RepID=UPI00140A4A16|nr:hypothetical protein [Phytoactinopolyspora limicola]